MSTINIQTPRWSLPLLRPCRYKLIKGGRGSGKSHERAEAVVEQMVMSPNDKVVCIREIQRSLKFSAKSLIESKIKQMGVSHLFEVLSTEIRRKGGDGICIFQGMMDHTADSIKSLEGFKIAWIEEAQSLSHKSLKLLRPTVMRMENSEIWATWNPDQPHDAIEVLCKNIQGSEDCVVVHVNYDENPFLPKPLRDEMLFDKQRYPEDYDWIWLGAYNTKKESRVFKHWCVKECYPTDQDDLYFGADWGFANDPTTLLRTWITEKDKTIYVDHQVDGVGVEIDHTPDMFKLIPDAKSHLIRADSARPEMNSHMRRHGFKVEGVKKGPGSVEAGIDWLRSYNIVVHPRCKLLEKELRLYSYKQNKAGDILPKLEDSNNHCIDALRYAYEPLIMGNKSWFMS